jgi:hypothetical protein
VTLTAQITDCAADTKIVGCSLIFIVAFRVIVLFPITVFYTGYVFQEAVTQPNRVTRNPPCIICMVCGLNRINWIALTSITVTAIFSGTRKLG